MPIKAVIFDLDGTLANFNLDYKTVRSLIKDYLLKKGVPATLLSLDDPVFEMLRKTEAWAKTSGQPPEYVENIQREALATTETYEVQAASTTNLLPGVAETLEALKSIGLKVGLCTINSERSVTHIMERFEISSFFDVVVSRNKVRHVKPDPEHLEFALRALNVLFDEVVVVGDSRVDMQSAKALGAIAVGLPTGVSTLEQLMAAGADYVVTSLVDVPELVKKLNEPPT
jgi:HAD superfamily hydrolase (TIGR01509 family)